MELWLKVNWEWIIPAESALSACCR